MHKRLIALPGRQATEHRRGGGREMVSSVEGATRGLGVLLSSGVAVIIPVLPQTRLLRTRAYYRCFA